MTQPAQDHYAILQLERTADDAQVRAAYRRCALAAHPDKGGCTQAFLAVSEAFETLSQPQERAAYDLRVASFQPARSKRRAVCPEELRQVALQRLEAAVASAPKECRRKLLTDFPARVAKALLEWMQSRGESQDTRVDLGESSAVSVPQNATDGMKVERDDLGSQGVHRASASSKGRSSQLYRASACCVNLNFLSRSTNIEKAIEFQAVLVVVRKATLQEVTKNPGVSSEELTKLILLRLVAACESMGVCPKDLGLTYRAVVSAIAVVGRQINGRATTDLFAALQQRERLLAARSSGWSALRDVWIQILTETRSIEKAEAYVDSIMRAFAPKRAQTDARQMRRLVDSQWQPFAHKPVETAEQQQTKELAAAVRSVEKALDATLSMSGIQKKPRTRDGVVQK